MLSDSSINFPMLCCGYSNIRCSFQTSAPWWEVRELHLDPAEEIQRQPLKLLQALKPALGVYLGIKYSMLAYSQGAVQVQDRGNLSVKQIPEDPPNFPPTLTDWVHPSEVGTARDVRIFSLLSPSRIWSAGSWVNAVGALCSLSGGSAPFCARSCV